MKVRPTAPKLDIEIVQHYHVKDTKFYGDYWGIDLYVNDELVHEFEDYYHDKGMEKIEGFTMALDYMGIPYEVTEKKVSDRE